MKNLRTAAWVMMIAAAFFLGACSGGGGGSDSTSSITGDTGTLSLKLIDKPADLDIDGFWVTVKEVWVCMESQEGDVNSEDPGLGWENEDSECVWEKKIDVNKTYNLLTLTGGVMEELGIVELDSGNYNQMRLILSDNNYMTDSEGNKLELEFKVPSGERTGIKLVHPFEIVQGLTTELILDFDVARSVVKAGNSNNYILKPTIKVIGTHSRAIVSGNVGDVGDVEGSLKDAEVSVQVFSAGDGTVSVITTTYTDENGDYLFYLDPGQYNIVVTHPGYEPACSTVLAEQDGIYEIDFSLAVAQTEPVSGTITGTLITGDGEAPVVNLSFRQDDLCTSGLAEIASDSITDALSYDADTGVFSYTYSIDLPIGTYDVVASTDGLVDADSSLNILDNTTWNITF